MMVVPSGGPEQRLGWRRLPRLVGNSVALVYAAAPREFTLSLLLELVQGATLGVNLLIVRNLLAAVLRGGSDYLPLFENLALLVGLQAVSGLINAYLTMQQQVLTELVQRYASRPVTEVATTIGLRDFDTPEFHDRMQRAQQTAMLRPFQVTQAVLGIGRGVLGVLGLAAGMFLLSPLLLAISLLGFVPLWAATARISRTVYQFMLEMTPNDRKRSYVLGLLTAREMAKEVRAFGLAPHFRSLYERLTDERIARLRRHLRQRAGLSLFGSAGSAVATGVTFGVLAWLITSGRIGLPAAGAVAAAAFQLGFQLQAIVLSAGQIYESGLFIGDLNAFLDLLPALRAAQPTQPAPVGFSRIAVEDVDFTYPTKPAPPPPSTPAPRPRFFAPWMMPPALAAPIAGADGHRRAHALRGVSMEIRRGEVVALVGENGSGKTTLAKVLAGLYPPDRGRVLWDGVDVSEVDPNQLRAQVTVIFQDFVRYMLTVRENIGLGRVERIEDLDAIRAAARHAGADQFIEAWPEAYEALLGPIFESGKDLSIGQWQRLALARAFFRDAPLIILDEPTAALDARAEAELFARTRALFRGRSVLLISHRFSSVRSADRIYVLKEGEIVEQGSHTELMAVGGLYAELFNLQAAAYLADTPAAPT